MTPYWSDEHLTVYQGDCRAVMATMEPASVHCVVTSPPYWGLRDYGESGQLGLEPTPEAYVANMVEVFREVRRVLRDDGTVWLNLGDSYAGSWGAQSRGNFPSDKSTLTTNNGRGPKAGDKYSALSAQQIEAAPKRTQTGTIRSEGIKPKDLVGIPWMVARALQEPYYTGRIRRERDRVWLAAMIDGEGTICGFDHDRADGQGHRSGVHVAITNTSTALLDEAARIWPTSRSAHQRPHAGHLGTKDSWRWIVHGIENKMAALSDLYPYLIAKRQQAVVGYTLLTLMADAKRLGHSSQKDAVIAKRRVLTGLLSDLNHQRPVVMPSWMVEPPSLYEPGWYLRSDIIWSKPNPMPESVTDRPTKSHEYLFLLTKSARYYFDGEAVREPADTADRTGERRSYKPGSASSMNDGEHQAMTGPFAGLPLNPAGRNIRSVWTIATAPYPGAHFATFPPKLVEPCVKAGSPAGGVVLDPFGGSGTTGMVAQSLGRRAVLIDLNGDYLVQAMKRNAQKGLGLSA